MPLVLCSTFLLVAVPLTSLVLLCVNHEKSGTIRLDGPCEPLHFASGVHLTQLESLDVMNVQDVADGLPVNEQAFRVKMTRRKMAVVSLQCAIVVLNFFLLAKSHSNPSPSAFSTYLLLLTIKWMNQKEIDEQLRIHIISLAGFFSAFTMALAMTSLQIPQTGAESLPWIITTSSAMVFTIVIRCDRGPNLYSSYGRDGYSATDAPNVSRSVSQSIWDTLVFAHTYPVLELYKQTSSFNLIDLPILPASMRAPINFSLMRQALGRYILSSENWTPSTGSGWKLGYQLFRLNAKGFGIQFLLAILTAITYYGPAVFLRKFIIYLELDTERNKTQEGWVYVFGLILASVLSVLISQQLWNISTTELEVKLKMQLNSILFGKTLFRKNVASTPSSDHSVSHSPGDIDFSNKAQVMTLMTTDADRVADFAWHIFALIDSPVEIAVGLYILHDLLGISSLVGLGSILLFFPISHWTGHLLVRNQEKLMKARDERVSLMNEVLSGIRMIKFMACERIFRDRVDHIRERELRHQKSTFIIETMWTMLWSASPIAIILLTFWHFTVIREQDLTPSIAFPSIIVFSSLKFVLNALPEAFVKILQSLVSLRRIEVYLESPEVSFPEESFTHRIVFEGCTISWPNGQLFTSNSASSMFRLADLNLSLPLGKMTLVCGQVGSGKSLLLLALLGEAEIVCGTVLCPRTPPNMLQFSDVKMITDEEWIVPGICAYVPQSTWLRNASIRDNILFNLPYNPARYRKTLEVCSLINDLEILNGGDALEIGEHGVNLSGGQKARVSLARAVYSRASIMILDDILSAVDAHTANHIMQECLKGCLMQHRTVILVSHHISLCAPEADYVVRLSGGKVEFQGSSELFLQCDSGTSSMLSISSESISNSDNSDQFLSTAMEVLLDTDSASERSEPTSTAAATAVEADIVETPRKSMDEEHRATGSIGRTTWASYLAACGSPSYWVFLLCILAAAALAPVAENSWLRHWSGMTSADSHLAVTYYISVYAAISILGLLISTARWLVLFSGSLQASKRLYEQLLNQILSANLRFHDTISRGRLLNRFGKDFEVIDSEISNNLGHTIVLALSVMATFEVIGLIAGFPFQIGVILIGFLYASASKAYGRTCRELRRLESITRSPLYSIYGEAISGAPVLRAFGACSVSMRSMLQYLDSNTSPYYWIWTANRWISTRFSLLSCCIVGIVAIICILTPSIDASLAGFILVFASTINEDVLYAVRYFVQLEQSMVAMERIAEYSAVESEATTSGKITPSEVWPDKGEIRWENLSVRYAESLPNVLQDLTFHISPGEKIGVLGRTGSGKSTFALSLFRFAEASAGKITIDDIDISTVGLNELRRKLSIIPQEPVLMSGTIRSTLDMFGEFSDADIYNALRRVRLIPSTDDSINMPELVCEFTSTIQDRKFSNLDEPVSEGGENFSTGEKQLLCLARALLKKAKILVMDEATASVDYSTDELISRTIREEFKESTVITIAHRLQTIIDYDRVMILDEGRLIESDSPANLLRNPGSYFYKICLAASPKPKETISR